MKTILCNSCGDTATRFINRCNRCKGDNLTHYSNYDDPEITTRINQIQGSPVDGLTRTMYASLILSVFAVVIYGYYQSMEVQMAHKTAPVQTAATSSAVPK